MKPEFRALETEIFKGRKERRIELIREAWAAYARELELTPLERLLRWFRGVRNWA